MDQVEIKLIFQRIDDIKSKVIHLYNSILNPIQLQYDEVKTYSFQTNLRKAKVENTRLEGRKNKIMIDCYLGIKVPYINEYKTDTFEILQTNNVKKGNILLECYTVDPFTTLKTTEIYGYKCNDYFLFLKRRNKLLSSRIMRNDSANAEGEPNALCLALPTLYPKSTFDFRRLIDFPKGKSLFPFQRDGVTFLMEKKGALLADEMGLGKSIQAIIATRLLFETGVVQSCLIICPKSILVDWESKFKEWAPDLSVSIMCGAVSSRKNIQDKRVQVFLITYDTLRETVLLTMEKDGYLNFDLIILDEIQKIKNRSTKTFQAISTVNGKIRWGLSGTPLENRIEDVTTIFSYIKPDLFRTTDVNNSLLVRSKIKPFVLRRTKDSVMKDIPEKIQHNIFLDLGQKQRAAYDLAERKGIIALEEKGVTATVTHVMALISQLKQICNIDPATGESVKLEYLQEMLENLYESDDKMLVFSQYPNKTLKMIKNKLEKYHPFIYHGSLSSKQREELLGRFKEDEKIKVLLISLRAGGLGLTLTKANYVVHLDSWWNPAVMTQAEDRTHRIGQKKNVFVTSLITQNTVEERIQKILKEKKKLFNEVIEGISDDSLIGLMTEKEIFSLFGLDKSKNRQPKIYIN